jgi:hypothetical protein
MTLVTMLVVVAVVAGIAIVNWPVVTEQVANLTGDDPEEPIDVDELPELGSLTLDEMAKDLEIGTRPVVVAPKGPVLAPITITIADGSPWTSVGVNCGGGVTRASPRFRGSPRKATVPGVNVENDCTLQFKGASAGSYGPVRGGRSYFCRLKGKVTVCD